MFAQTFVSTVSKVETTSSSSSSNRTCESERQAGIQPLLISFPICICEQLNLKTAKGLRHLLKLFVQDQHSVQSHSDGDKHAGLAFKSVTVDILLETVPNFIISVLSDFFYFTITGYDLIPPPRLPPPPSPAISSLPPSLRPCDV